MIFNNTKEQVELSQEEVNLEKWFSIAPGLVAIAEKAYNMSGEIYPPKELVFRALELVSPEQVRVVVLGQDPYHTKGKASGLAFGYNEDYRGKVDSSLENIRKELVNCGFSLADTSLENWAKQGVLLLNSRLTVEQGKPMSHAYIGWEYQVEKIINHLATRKIVWMLWGREAQLLLRGMPVAGKVIRTSHPCKFSHKTGERAFTGSKCFQRCNKELPALGHTPINWSGTGFPAAEEEEK